MPIVLTVSSIGRTNPGEIVLRYSLIFIIFLHFACAGGEDDENLSDNESLADTIETGKLSLTDKDKFKNLSTEEQQALLTTPKKTGEIVLKEKNDTTNTSGKILLPSENTDDKSNTKNLKLAAEKDFDPSGLGDGKEWVLAKDIILECPNTEITLEVIKYKSEDCLDAKTYKEQVVRCKLVDELDDIPDRCIAYCGNSQCKESPSPSEIITLRANCLKRGGEFEESYKIGKENYPFPRCVE